MSIPINQHYVPVFYLRNFSNDVERAHIAWYNYSLSKVAAFSPIKKVASQDNFYGENSEMEKTYADIESRASKVIGEIILSGQLKRNDGLKKFLLWLYTFIQFSRTSKRVTQFPQILKGAVKNMQDISKENAEIIEKLKLPSSIIMGLNYQNFFSVFPDTLDLHIKFVINRSPLPFITSDHPVFTYNQFLEKKEPAYNGNGLLLKGTQVFLPISPAHLIIFYDHEVYKIDSYKKSVYVTNSIEDAKSINCLSALNAAEKVFFSNSDDHKSFDYYRNFRNKHIKRTTGMEIPKTGFNLSFVRMLDKAKIWKPNGPLSYFRNEKAGLKSLYPELRKY